MAGWGGRSCRYGRVRAGGLALEGINWVFTGFAVELRVEACERCRTV